MSNIFKEASKLRKSHPRMYSDWQDYVQAAKRKVKGKPAGKKKPAKKRKAAAAAARPKNARKAVSGSSAMGSISFHKNQARKQVKEKLAWMLLARDQEKGKRERTKLSKKVALLRQELHNLK